MFSFTNTVSTFFKKVTVKDIFLLFFTILSFALTRLTNLLKLPIFSDEGIYLNWAKIAAYDPAWRFISLTDGKQPLQTWGTLILIKLLPNHTLLAGRLFSVFFGIVAIVGLFFLCRYLWGKTAGWIGAFVYLFTPYFIFYDRIALVDSAVNAIFIWILFLAIVLSKSKRLDIALIFGIIAGIGSLAKSTMILLIFLTSFGFLYGEKSLLPFNQKKLKSIIDYLFLFLIGFFVALCIYQIQRLSPFFHYISQKNTTFILTPIEFLANPFQLLKNNLTILPIYIFWESGWFLPSLGIVGYIALFKNERNLARFLLVMLLIPTILVLFFNKVLFPRYVIFLATLLILPSIYLITRLNNTYKIKLFYLTLSVIFMIGFTFSLNLQFRPAQISLPPVDYGQYISGETAVWGARELMQEVRTRKGEKKAIILAEGNFGLVADVLQVYLKRDDNIEIKGLWPLDISDVIKYSQSETTQSAVFAVFPHREKFTPDWPMKLIKKYDKPASNKALYLFEVLPFGINPEIDNLPH